MGLNPNSSSNPSNSVTLNVQSQAVSTFSTPKLREYESAEFTITGEIGVGSFSIVLRCRNRKLDETVAVKVFGLTGSHIGIERKLNEAMEEAKKLSIIKHPHIVEVHGITRWRNHCGIIMQEVKGGNLEDLLFYLQIETLPWVLRLRLCLQIAEALNYLHSESLESPNVRKPCMQHCDVKPQNILLTESGIVKLCDLSAAVVAHATGLASSSCSFPNARQFTPNYTAPEIVVDGKCHFKSDVYSLGIIMFEIITRRRAFEGQNPEIILNLLKGSGVTPNMTFVEQVGAILDGQDFKIFLGIKKIMTKCWKRNVEERLSAAQVLLELRSLIISLNIRESDLNDVEIPKEFLKLVSRRSSSSTEQSVPKRLDQLNVFALNASHQHENVAASSSSEGAFLALKKGKLLKYNVANKTITMLESGADEDYLHGLLVKNGSSIYIVDMISQIHTIKKLRLNGNKWQCEVLDSKNSEKTFHAAVTSYKKWLFVTGGLQDTTRETLDIFDLERRNWTHMRDMNRKRQGHMLVEAEDVLYAMGGYEMNSVETFDLHDTEAWREIQPMTLERYGSAVVLMNRKIYALGGFDNRNHKLLSSVEVFDLMNNTWEQGGVCLNVARCWHGACVIGKRIYAVGGETNVLESYDPCSIHGWKIECENDLFKGISSIVAL